MLAAASKEQKARIRKCMKRVRASARLLSLFRRKARNISVSSLWCRFATTFTLDNFEPPAFAALNLSHPSHPRTNTYRTKLVLRCVAEAGVPPRGNTSDFLKTQTVLTAHPLFSWKYVLSFVKKSYTLYEESCVRVITSATLIDNTRVRQFHFANPIIVQCSIQLLY